MTPYPSPNDKPRPHRGLYGSLWHFARGARLALVSAFVLLVGSQVMRLAVPWLAGRAIDVLQRGGPDAALHAGSWVVGLLAVSIGTWGLHGPGRILERAVGVRVRRAVTHALFDKLADAPLKWHDRHPASDLQQRMGQASGALDAFAQTQYVILQGLVTFVGTLVALVVFSPRTGAFAIAGYALLVVASLRFDRTLVGLAAQENVASRRFASGVLEFVGGIVTVHALRLSGAMKRQLDGRLEAIFEPLKRSIRVNEAKWCFVELLTTGLTWAIVALYVWQVERSGSALLIGGVFVIYKYAEQAGSVVGNAASQFQGFAHLKVDYASADTIWDAPSRSDRAATLPQDWRTIELHDVGFRHDGEGTHGIEGVDLTLRRGERIALVGPSGAGKSTLMRVMAGLYTASSGHLCVDGIAHLGVRPLASVSTFIPQDADIFETTLRDNIVFDETGDETARQAALQDALAVSALDDVLATMPAGLDTPVAERGVNLSGGQRQRVCLARGVLAARDSSLILLDEPTSALDALTEARVYRELERRFPDACIVASVHRMSLLDHFDRVVLMHDGDLLDSGTVTELRARQPLFAAMIGGVDESADERAAA